MRTTRFPATASGVTERMAGFIAHLRYNGYRAGVAETEATLNALRLIDVEEHDQVRLACKAVCASSKENFEQFNELFDSYWFNRGREKPGTESTEKRSSDKQQSRYRPGVEESQSATGEGTAEQPENNAGEGEAHQSGEGRLIASEIKNLNKTDFREFATPELQEQAEALACKLAKAMRDRRSRRYRLSQRGNKLNLRKTIRNSVNQGGVPLQLYRQNRPDRPVKIVTLLDVSGSMTVYARVFLAFLKGLISHDTRADAYLFHTALGITAVSYNDLPQSHANRFIVVSTQGSGDVAALQKACSLDASFISFVGSPRKMQHLKDKLKSLDTPQQQIDSIKGPAGLNIGGVTPQEIALSILAELVALRRGVSAPAPAQIK